jgi:bifunctional UDP-N-acetylglucosamine pyrophosphorylase/glucosamine-1-phosphate N-acetyltransferase
MRAVVLAAGKGIRLRPLTEKKPKALVELSGKPLIEWVLERLGEAGVRETAIVVGYLGEMIEETLGNSFGEMQLHYIRQEEQLGTANAIASAEPFVENSFICTYTDVIAESSIFKQLVEKFSEKKQGVFLEAVEKAKQEFDAAIVGREVRDPWRFGALRIEGNRVVDIVEKPTIGEEPSNIVNAGIYWFSARIFGAIRRIGKSIRGEYEITDALKELAKEGRLCFIPYRGKCIDISTADDLKEAEETLAL